MKVEILGFECVWVFLCVSMWRERYVLTCVCGFDKCHRTGRTLTHSGWGCHPHLQRIQALEEARKEEEDIRCTYLPWEHKGKYFWVQAITDLVCGVRQVMQRQVGEVWLHPAAVGAPTSPGRLPVHCVASDATVGTWWWRPGHHRPSRPWHHCLHTGRCLWNCWGEKGWWCMSFWCFS